jgi:hypothetical protein
VFDIEASLKWFSNSSSARRCWREKNASSIDKLAKRPFYEAMKLGLNFDVFVWQLDVWDEKGGCRWELIENVVVGKNAEDAARKCREKRRRDKKRIREGNSKNCRNR